MKEFCPAKMKKLRGANTLEDLVYLLRCKGTRITQATLCNYETGKHVPSANTVARIAHALDGEIMDLYSEIEEECVNA